MLRRALRVLAILSLVWTCLALPLAAQGNLDFDSFSSFADTVEGAIETSDATDDEFRALRSQLVDWRAGFADAQDVNSARIASLEAQLDALGPSPAEGETEPDSLASRREALNTQLTVARAPRLEAEEAAARATSLIGQIDTTLRARQTDALFELTRTPLDPTLWSGTVASGLRVIDTIRTEATNRLSEPSTTGLWQRLALAAALLVFAAFLIARGPGLVERLLARIETTAGEHGRIVYGFLLSFSGVLMAMAGVSLINAALITTGILGPIGQATAIGINAAILSSAIARWLGGRIFPERDAIPSPLDLTERQRAKGRFFSTLLGVLAGLSVILRVVASRAEIAPDYIGVMGLPIHLATGYVLFRLGKLLVHGGAVGADTEVTIAHHAARILGTAVQAVGIIGPLAALVGFRALAQELIAPTAATLALVAFLASLHFAVRGAYAIARGLDAKQAQQALVPVLISLGLTLAAIPVLALVWGAEPSDLGEAWTRFRTGFKLGDTTISPGDFITFIVVFAIGLAVTRLFQGTLKTTVLPRTKLDRGGQNAIVSGLGYLGLTLAAVIGISAAGIDLSSFAIVIGALGVGIGFGLQNIVNNFVSGIILLIERPISEGDWVEAGGQMGVVKAISVRSTRIETFDKRDVIVPNGDLISGTVTNWTHGNSMGRVIVPVGVAYGTDTRKVERVLKEIAEAHPIVAVTPAPNILFIGFGADSMDFEIRAILTDVSFVVAAKSDMNHEIARRFGEEGIEIPFAQRDIWLRNPEALVKASNEPRPASDALDPALADPDQDGD
jgi:potassium-dependent mechanosensitive channel